jgi:uncharacterized protein YcsI (UPF0317 family)
LADNYVQANIVILPRAYAYDFLLFCMRNPRPCPLLDVSEPGIPAPPEWLTKHGDIRTDVPAYQVFNDGELVEETNDISKYWQDDFVTFYLGCSFSFEAALQQSGLPVRHIEQGCNVPMYLTTIPCRDAGIFTDINMVVSMRPFLPHQISSVIESTSRYHRVHGAPIHIGDPAAIGIKDLSQPDFGDAVITKPDEVPAFWACGVTPVRAILQAKYVEYEGVCIGRFLRFVQCHLTCKPIVHITHTDPRE